MNLVEKAGISFEMKPFPPSLCDEMDCAVLYAPSPSLFDALRVNGCLARYSVVDKLRKR